MTPQTIDHSTLARLVEAGAVRNAHVVGQEGGWAVLVKYGMAECVLMAQRNQQVRLFKRIETLVSYLKKLGISHFAVDSAGYAPEKVRTYSRPDRAEALRRAHEAAAHDKWFRSQVEEAVREADDPATEWVSHEAVRQDMAQQRIALQARLKGP